MKIISTKNKLQDRSFLSISRFKEVIKKTRPHKHEEYYEFLFLTEGEGFHTIESETYIISAPDIYILQPGQMHYWQFSSIPKGFVVLCKEEEFDSLTEIKIGNALKSLINHVRIKVQKEEFPQVILEEIYKESLLSDNYSKEIMHGLLSVLFSNLLRIVNKQEADTFNPQSIFSRFESLLLNESPRLHKVNEFAECLCVTPQNLNNICRKHVQRSASDLIKERIVLEAKRYLLHTDNTVDEIADILMFSATSNFIKFFKTHTNATPLQYRKAVDLK
jgi:AraC-like DNA-binding protein